MTLAKLSGSTSLVCAGLAGLCISASVASDHVIEVASGVVQELSVPIDTADRVVKTGAGTLVLPAGNSFRGGVLVENGILRADYQASGLQSTHLALDGATYSAPAYLQVVGGSFTAPVAESGNGTISLNRYAGIVPYDQDLTINFGGDGRKLTVGENGFTPTDLILNNSTTCKSTLVNPIDQNGAENLTIKSGSAPLYIQHFTNSVNSGELNFWGGSLVFDAGSFFRTRRVSWRDGTVAFTNATIRMYNDFKVGCSDGNSGLARVTLVNCDKKTSWGTDHVNGNDGTTFTIDGGTYVNVGGMRLGEISGKTGTLILTNNVRYTCTDGGGSAGFYLGNGSRVLQAGGLVELNDQWARLLVADGVYEMTGGVMTNNAGWMNDFQIGSENNAALAGAFLMKGGRVYLGSSVSVQVGASGKGTFLQTGGEVNVGGYCAPGRYATGIGSMLIHGGQFTHRLSSGGTFNVGEEGSGYVSVANGGVLEVVDNDGVVLASSWSSGAKGMVRLSPGGLLKAKRIKGTDNTSSFVFNGGTFEISGYSGASINNTNSIINTYVDRAVVTSLGGAIDNGNQPTIRLARALISSAVADDTCEAMGHRWKFDGESLADCVGDSPATIGGTVEWTKDAVRLKGTAQGTSYVKLGTGLLPTDGRGTTIEVTFTLNKHTNWARIFDFGATGADLCWTFNRGGSSSTFISIKGLPSWTGSYRLVEGRRYQVSLVFDHEYDGTWKLTGYIHEPGTGTLLETARLTAPKTFSLGDFSAIDCRLGCSSAATDDDPGADYEDVRIYNRAMTEAQLAEDAVDGADKIFYFTKKGAGELLMSGANTYPVGTRVAEGALKLADGATLPQSEIRVDANATLALNVTAQQASRLEGAGRVAGGSLTVAGAILPGGMETVGTLTLDGTTLVAGTGAKLVVDTANGTSDCLELTGNVDLSSFDLELANPEALDEETSYVIVRAATVTGTFRSATLPRHWRLLYGPTSVRLSNGNGLKIIIR